MHSTQDSRAVESHSKSKAMNEIAKWEKNINLERVSDL